MHPRLSAPFDAFERRKQNLLSQLSALDDAQLRFRPAPDAWSLLDVADHLSRTEAAVAEALDAGIPEDRAKRKLKHVVKFRLALIALRLPVKIEVPAKADNVRPAGGLTLDGVRESWAENRALLEKRLAAYGDEDLQRMVVRHPVAGPVNPCHTISFLNAHFDHHRFQVDRIRKHPAFPVGGRTTDAA